jgi:protein-disulfide isomerase
MDRIGNLKKFTGHAANVVLVACAVIVTWLAISSRRQPETTTVGLKFEEQPDWLKFVEDGYRIGSPNAVVRAVEFADFQCPACRHLNETLNEIILRRPNDFAVYFRHFPLNSHRFAVEAGIAAECAHRQGVFATMKDSLFSAQHQIGQKPWSQFAAETGVRDTVQFRDCMSEPGAANIVTRDRAVADELGLRGTPTLMIDGKRFVGVASREVLDSLIDASLVKRGK